MIDVKPGESVAQLSSTGKQTPSQTMGIEGLPVPASSTTSSSTAAATAMAQLAGRRVLDLFQQWTSSASKRSIVGPVRSFGTFLSRDQFSLPRNMEESSTRFELNTQYYSGNYALISSILLVYVLLTSPALMVFLVVMGASWMFYVSKHEPLLVIGHRIALRGSQKAILWCGLSVLGVIYLSGTTLIYLCAICVIAAIVHATTHSVMVDDDHHDDPDDLTRLTGTVDLEPELMTTDTL